MGPRKKARRLRGWEGPSVSAGSALPAAPPTILAPPSTSSAERNASCRRLYDGSIYRCSSVHERQCIRYRSGSGDSVGHLTVRNCVRRDTLFSRLSTRSCLLLATASSVTMCEGSRRLGAMVRVRASGRGHVLSVLSRISKAGHAGGCRPVHRAPSRSVMAAHVHTCVRTSVRTGIASHHITSLDQPLVCRSRARKSRQGCLPISGCCSHGTAVCMRSRWRSGCMVRARMQLEAGEAP